MNRYEILYINEVDKCEWDACVLNSDLGYVYDFYQMLMESEYEKSLNLTFAIKDMEEAHIVLIMPLFYRKNILIEYEDESFEFYSRYGPVIRCGINKKEKKEIERVFWENLKQLMTYYRQKELYVELAALCSYGFPDYNIVNPLIFWGFEPRIRYTWIVDLENDECKLFNNLNRTTRKSIKRISSDANFFVRESFSGNIKGDFEKFVLLSEETYLRNGIMPKSKRYYWNQFQHVASDARRIFFLEKCRGEVCEGAMMVHLYKNTARITWVVSADIKDKDTVKFMIYNVMLALKSSGVKYIEIGGAYPYYSSSDKRRRISDFKKSFGGILHPIYMGYYKMS